MRKFLPVAAAAAAAEPPAVEREFFRLFIGVGRGEMMPYASWYLTGFLHDRPLADLRGDLRRLGVERARRLLGAPGARLSEVALSTGFADQAHLTRLFKREFGVTPGRVLRSSGTAPGAPPPR